MHMVGWIRRASEYAVGAALVLGHLALAGRRLALVETLSPPDARPRGEGAPATPPVPVREASAEPLSRASG